MVTKTVLEAPAKEIDSESVNGLAKQDVGVQRGILQSPELEYMLVEPPADRAHLPTFPVEEGFREYTDPETGKLCQVPLTPIDIYYPTDEDVGVDRLTFQRPL